jgi:hypothetical protein
MTTLDPAGRLAAVMRTQVATLRRKLPPKQGARAQPTTNKSAARQEADFAALVAQRVQALDPHDPALEDKAVRIYLESVILAELGANLASDPAFATMMDDIHRQMAKEPQLARALADAASILLGRAPG